jgi:hypothetical protein
MPGDPPAAMPGSTPRYLTKLSLLTRGVLTKINHLLVTRTGFMHSADARKSQPAVQASHARVRKQTAADRAHSVASAGICLGFLVALIAPCVLIKVLAPDAPAATSSLAHSATHAAPAADARKKSLRPA